MRRIPLLVTAATLALTGCTAQAATIATVTATMSPAPSARTPFVSGLTIPWAVGGPRQERNGSVRYFPGEWPTPHVSAIRLWDTYTTWADLEPRPGQWRLWRLDGFVEKARSRGTSDITLVLGGTPPWAATRFAPADAPWIGPGSASAPSTMSAWRDYVTTVATRYRGRITAYEIGNEPNLRMFWNGTPQQYADLVAVAAEAISTADPSALVVANVGLVRRPGDVRALSTWLAPVAAVPGVDVLSVHAYPRASALGRSDALLASTAAAVSALDPQHRPLWMTEVNVTDGAALPGRQQRAAVEALTAGMRASGFARAYWYSWTAIGAPGLIPIHSRTPGNRALRDLGVARS